MKGHAYIGWLLPPLLAAFPAAAYDVYTWRDAAGVTHFSDQTHPGAGHLHFPDPQRIAKLATTIKHVVDGDTVDLADGTRIRLIGVNAPEIPRRNLPGEPGGLAAERYLRRLAEGKQVRVEPGPAAKDRYGRRLAYVTLLDGSDLSLLLLQAGEAIAEPIPPNTDRAANYAEAETEARQAGRGLWRFRRYGVWPTPRAAEFRNSFRRLRGRVVAIEQHPAGVRLQLDGLDAQIPAETVEALRAAGKPPRQMQGKTVVLRGWVGQRKGVPTIVIRHPLQVEAIE